MFTNPPKTLRLTRRVFLRAAGAAFALSGGALFLQGCAQLAQVEQLPAVSAPDSVQPETSAPDVEIALTVRKGTTQILPGAATETWSYHGEVIRGDARAVQAIPDSYLGPILRARRGQRVRFHMDNQLDEETIIHWHGLIVPPEMDGHPQDAVGPGQTYVYEFEVRNRAGAYWFHPHPHGRTGYQVNMGLAGLFLVGDDEEDAAGLPTGDYDVPLVIQDRTFDANNQFVYVNGNEGHGSGHGMHGMSNMQGMMGNMMESMEQTMGFLGETILVNGRPDFVLPVAARPYRLRLLNGSSSRIYKLAWSNGAPMTVIATDGGLIEQPTSYPYVTLSPGERVELWADFSQESVGGEIKLQSLAYTGVEAGMFMGGMMMEMEHTATLPNGAPFDVLAVRVEQAAPKDPSETLAPPGGLGARLATLERLQATDAVNAAQPRPFALGMAGGNWLINGKPFVMNEVADDERVALGSTEVWEFINELDATGMVLGSQAHLGHAQGGHSGGMAMQGAMMDFMAHPIHLHGVQFQVLARTIDPAYERAWRTVSEGFVDGGWKDTVLVMPGERVKLIMRFADFAGIYLFHCHNLEHEDLGMMRNFLIEERL